MANRAESQFGFPVDTSYTIFDTDTGLSMTNLIRDIFGNPSGHTDQLEIDIANSHAMAIAKTLSQKRYEDLGVQTHVIDLGQPFSAEDLVSGQEGHMNTFGIDAESRRMIERLLASSSNLPNRYFRAYNALSIRSRTRILQAFYRYDLLPEDRIILAIKDRLGSDEAGVTYSLEAAGGKIPEECFYDIAIRRVDNPDAAFPVEIMDMLKDATSDCPSLVPYYHSKGSVLLELEGEGERSGFFGWLKGVCGLCRYPTVRMDFFYDTGQTVSLKADHAKYQISEEIFINHALPSILNALEALHSSNLTLGAEGLNAKNILIPTYNIEGGSALSAAEPVISNYDSVKLVDSDQLAIPAEDIRLLGNLICDLFFHGNSQGDLIGVDPTQTIDLSGIADDSTLKDIVQMCTQQDPDNRPTIDDIRRIIAGGSAVEA